MDYVELFVAEFICARSTSVRETAPGEYSVSHPDMTITRCKINISVRFGWPEDSFVSSCIIKPTYCTLIHMHRGSRTRRSWTEKERVDYEKVMWVVERDIHGLIYAIDDSHVLEDYIPEHVIPRQLAEEIDRHMCRGLLKYMPWRPEWGRVVVNTPIDHLALFVAKFVIPDCIRVFKRRDFLSCALTMPGVKLFVRCGRIKIYMNWCTYVITRDSIKDKIAHDMLVYISYSKIIRYISQHLSHADTAHCGAFAQVVDGILPQPIAEEITPHLCRGLRSYAWYAFDN